MNYLLKKNLTNSINQQIVQKGSNQLRIFYLIINRSSDNYKMNYVEQQCSLASMCLFAECQQQQLNFRSLVTAIKIQKCTNIEIQLDLL
ncbi:hypothetical protein pb186bvf_006965 [Paramecium bursaria]